MTDAAPAHAPRLLPARPRPIVTATELGSVAVLKEGALILLSDERGDIAPDRRGLGLYLGDTRALSTLALEVEDGPPSLLRTDPGGSSRGVIHLTNPDLASDPTRAIDLPIALPRQSIGIRRERRIEPPALVERLAVTNYTGVPQRVPVRLHVDADGADIFEVRGRRRTRRGEQLPVEVEAGRLMFRYRGLDGRELTTEVGLDPAPDAIEPADDADPGVVVATWLLCVPPAEELEIGWTVTPSWNDGADDQADAAGDRADAIASNGPAAAHAARPTPGSVAAPAPGPSAPADVEASIETDDEIVNAILARAIADLRLLRTPGPGADEHFVAAGIPWFATLFGRDSLVASHLALPYVPELARDALTVLARLQADRDDPTTDAEPGKILHELRTGEMARTGEVPFARYYGSVDATPLWLMLLGETAAWTGDEQLVGRLWPHAIRALSWLEDAPRDADGFLVYRPRAQGGLRNQGWKDSSDAIRDRDGRILEPPIAVAEAQAYAIEARRVASRLARARGDVGLADALERAAADLAARFDARFRPSGGDRYAMAIAADGSVADALASNVGHCLWAGAVPPERAPAVARELLSPALFSGWGIRTYGAGQPGFNPLGYHTGSVWPHDSAIAAAGLKRYGFHEEATSVAWAVLDAARRSPGFRLPEHFCGFDRDASDSPVVHPVSCAPQAWAAASALGLVTTILGLRPDAAQHELEIVRPVLPPGLGMVRLRGLAVGTARVDLLFHRWRGTTSAEVLDRSGDLRVTVRL